MSSRQYDVVVIGAGPGGYPCAIRLAQLGLKTLCIDKGAWGGVCLNVGCIPSKALITASKRKKQLENAGAMGIASGAISVDLPRLQAWKDSVVHRLGTGVETLLRANGVELVQGTARLLDVGHVGVRAANGVETIYASDHIVVATGSRPIELPGFSFADGPILDSTQALSLNARPHHLMVIGGGYIGLELGMLYAGLGSRVSIVERASQILPGFERDVVRALGRSLRQADVSVHLGSTALGWEHSPDGVSLQVQTPEGPTSLTGNAVLVTVGRRPNTENLGLDPLGVEMDGAFIRVDAQCRTNVPGLYAIGDVVGQPMLAHKATHEAEVVAEVIAGRPVQLSARAVPAVVFTDPEVAVVGLDEPRARELGHDVRVGKVPYAAVPRSVTVGDTRGFYKVVIDAATQRILGVTIVGHHASDVISEAALAVEMEAEALDVARTIHPHPTLGEGIMEAVKAALGEAVHVINR